MLIILNGTLGVGKTWIARWLVENLESAACIEGDPLGFISRNLFLDSSREAFGLEVAIELIKTYRSKGASSIIFDKAFIDPATFKKFIASSGDEAHVFYLSASKDTIAMRIRQRGRPHAEREIADAAEIETKQRSHFSKEGLGFEIVTDALSPEQIVRLIKEQLQLN